MNMMYIILTNMVAFSIAIIICVFIHEFGHFFAARRMGVHVTVFSMGMGPKICEWVDKLGTKWCLSYFPIGGYIKMLGDEETEAKTKHKEKSKGGYKKTQEYESKNLLQKFVIIFSGPLANLILAITVISILLSMNGVYNVDTVVSDVEINSPAYNKLYKDDKILAVDGVEVQQFADIKKEMMLNRNDVISLLVLRDGAQQNVNIELSGSKILGIHSSEPVHIDLSVLESVGRSFIECYKLTCITFEAITNMIFYQKNLEDVSGVIKIATVSGESMRYGLQNFTWFIAFLSLNLFIFNILPIPLLDGGHMFLILIQAIIRRPIPIKFVQYFNSMGFTILLSLMLFATYNDVNSLFFK